MAICLNVKLKHKNRCRHVKLGCSSCTVHVFWNVKDKPLVTPQVSVSVGVKVISHLMLTIFVFLLIKVTWYYVRAQVSMSVKVVQWGCSRQKGQREITVSIHWGGRGGDTAETAWLKWPASSLLQHSSVSSFTHKETTIWCKSKTQMWRVFDKEPSAFIPHSQTKED